MKPGIHPQYVEATVTCACGNTFKTRSTSREIHTDLCNVCHPFYTGEQRIVDTAGQVERFMRRVEAAQSAERRTSKRQQRLQARAAQAAEQERRQAEVEARQRTTGGQPEPTPTTPEAATEETPVQA
jgi:large subunit ribosomal protein L31